MRQAKSRNQDSASQGNLKSRAVIVKFISNKSKVKLVVRRPATVA